MGLILLTYGTSVRDKQRRRSGSVTCVYRYMDACENLGHFQARDENTVTCPLGVFAELGGFTAWLMFRSPERHKMTVW